MKVYNVNSIYNVNSNIMSCMYFCIDEKMMIVTKKLKNNICLCASLAAYIPNVTIRQKFFNNFLIQIITKGYKNDRMGLLPFTASCRKSFMKERRETGKEKSI